MRHHWIKATLLLFACAPLDAQIQPMRRTSNPHGPLKVACESCHTASRWRPIRPQPEFNHNTQTNYPLRGMHEGVACSGCHLDAVFRNAAHDCAACHADVHRRQFGAQCQQCHTVKGWRTEVRQTREHFNRFPLIGAHASTPCESCHKSAATGVYQGLSTECAACHINDYQRTQAPPHGASKLPLQCSQCHSMDSWAGARFDHGTTRFALTGAHARVECRLCHVGNRFTGTPMECFSCHAAQFSTARNPDHAAAGFPKDCMQCHTTSQWKGATFDHSSRSSFALTGAHTSVQCNACHLAGRFAGTPQACEGCHLEAFNKTTNPGHVASNFPRDCAQCHVTAQWKGAKFDHALSRFKLTGAHIQVECASCHTSGRFTGTPQACEGCHTQAFNQAANPNHVSSGFPRDCQLCHVTSQWKGAKFDHGTQTKFPLTGAHSNVQCALCHTGGNFAGTTQSCEGCHLADYSKTTNPAHSAAGFSRECQQCHTTAAWKGAKYDHGALTKFPLTGAHVTIQCVACHVGGRFAGTAQSCEGCHLTDFNKATNPNHVTSGFPTDCKVCHTTDTWKGARFDHTAQTKFALTGKHVQAQCGLCHLGGRFAGTPQACEGCHLPEFTKSTDPNHPSAGFGKDCQQCHVTVQWKRTTFDHSVATKFPLTGKHASVDCLLCHVGNKYAGTPASCEGCHLPDFNKTTNPNHVTAGFPQACATCHTTAQWLGAKFDHSTQTKFALTGKHTTVQCGLCHVGNKFVGTPTACEGCHLPKYQQTTNPNHPAAGFSQNCAQCH
ncbi:MAG: hypothetical protein HZB13_15275, partial [Acidobacteria bacterium]|nr:hypothetical protein [Acidobacteriota bacterium]